MELDGSRRIVIRWDDRKRADSRASCMSLAILTNSEIRERGIAIGTEGRVHRW